MKGMKRKLTSAKTARDPNSRINKALRKWACQMALSTYSELKSAIANWLNRTDLTDEIADDFIKLTEADFNAKLRIRAMEQIDTITIDSETETVPTGFIAVRSFYILSNSTKYPLEYITPANMFETRGGSKTCKIMIT